MYTFYHQRKTWFFFHCKYKCTSRVYYVCVCVRIFQFNFKLSFSVCWRRKRHTYSGRTLWISSDFDLNSYLNKNLSAPTDRDALWAAQSVAGRASRLAPEDDFGSCYIVWYVYTYRVRVPGECFAAVSFHAFGRWNEMVFRWNVCAGSRCRNTRTYVILPI